MEEHVTTFQFINLLSTIFCHSKKKEKKKNFKLEILLVDLMNTGSSCMKILIAHITPENSIGINQLIRMGDGRYYFLLSKLLPNIYKASNRTLIADLQK